MIFPVEVQGIPCYCFVVGYDYKTDDYAYELTDSQGNALEGWELLMDQETKDELIQAIKHINTLVQCNRMPALI